MIDEMNPRGPAMYGLNPEPPPVLVCECCERVVDKVRGSMWGHQHCCLECFYQWYDPDNSSFDSCNPREIGNYVRSKHGLPPLPDQDTL